MWLSHRPRENWNTAVHRPQGFLYSIVLWKKESVMYTIYRGPNGVGVRKRRNILVCVLKTKRKRKRLIKKKKKIRPRRRDE